MQFRRHGLAVEPLLQHVERLHAALAHDQQLAVDARRRSASASSEIGKALRDILAGARIEPRHHARRPRACRRPPARGCRPISIRPMKSAGSSAARSGLLDRMRQHRRAERRRDRATDRLARRGLRARRTVRDRAAASPARSARSRAASLSPSAATAVLASRAETPMRKRAGDELQQRPAPGLVERVEPARELRRAAALLPSVASVVDRRR